MRAVVYARYSSENQRDASIEDQIRTCRAEIDRRGWTFVSVHFDRATSGASTLRSGYQRLLEVARAGEADVVVSEALDRLSRDQADIANLYKQLSYLGVRLFTLSEGDITELHVGLKGTMNALFLKDLAKKTHRGLEGKVREGRSGGGLSFGYSVVAGDLGARHIVPSEAETVRRIFREFVAGKSPRNIARQLNNEGVPGPRGGGWRDTTIRGHILRDTGILNNQLYVGQLVWNRLSYVKEPTTGRRRSRRNPKEDWIVKQVPELRVVDDELWNAAKLRQRTIRESEGVIKTRASRFWEHRRPRHFLTGLVFCGSCDSRLAVVGQDYLGCSAARGKGTCNNRRSIRRSALEGLILTAFKKQLMAPDLVKEFITAFNAEMNANLRGQGEARNNKQKQLAAVERQLSGLIDAIAEGLRGPDIQGRLDDLHVRKVELQRHLSSPPDPVVRLHPNLSELYRKKVETLHVALANPIDREEAIEIIRSIIDRIVLLPRQDGYEVEVSGEIAKMIEIALGKPNKTAPLNEDAIRSVKVVAGARFELTTFRL